MYPYVITRHTDKDDAELEEYPATTEELSPQDTLINKKLPWYWRVYYAFFPSNREQIRPWCLGVLMDLCFLLMIIVLIVGVYWDQPDKIREAWFFPLLGIFGAIISTSTPAGTASF